MRRRFVAPAVVLTALAALLTISHPPSAVSTVDEIAPPDQGRVDVDVRDVVQLEADTPPPHRTRRVSLPPPVCWWSEIAHIGKDPELFAEYFRGVANSLGTADMIERMYLALPRGGESLNEAVAAEQAMDEPGVTWYELKWDSTRLDQGGDVAAALVDAGCTTSKPWRDGSRVLVTFGFFGHGSPPAPQIDPRDLALYAHDSMHLVPPALGWNPKIGARDDAALVNLPTWFWVEDPLAARPRWIIARVGDVWARVDASPRGMTVVAPGESVECTSAQARRRYREGRDDASACTLTFTAASFGRPEGFAVTAETTWSATWTSSTGEGGRFETRTVAATTNVPVVSSQALVTAVD